MTTSEATIVCHDCGGEIVRAPTHLMCVCRMGFVAQWDRSLGEGRYLGRIADPVDLGASSVPVSARPARIQPEVTK